MGTINTLNAMALEALPRAKYGVIDLVDGEGRRVGTVECGDEAARTRWSRLFVASAQMASVVERLGHLVALELADESEADPLEVLSRLQESPRVLNVCIPEAAVEALMEVFEEVRGLVRTEREVNCCVCGMSLLDAPGFQTIPQRGVACLGCDDLSVAEDDR